MVSYVYIIQYVVFTILMPGYELIGEEERHEIMDVLDNGGVLFRHGFNSLRSNRFKVRDFEIAFAEYMSCNYALAVTSGTAALRVALAALGVGPGDEVITQSFTFVATVEAIIESGATPVCADIDMTLNLDPIALEGLITPQTKAVIAVHMLGGAANINEIKRICEKHSLFLIEDTAWGCGGRINNKHLGTFGDIGTFSFDYAKTMTTGEGGMLTFSDESIYKRAYAWHDHGHENNPQFARWEDTRTSSGFNYRMMELQGAIGLAQLKKLTNVIEKQRQNKEMLWNSLKDLPGIERRHMPLDAYDTADALIIVFKTHELAKDCRTKLAHVEITTKILPEAISWHFAGEWNHMHQLKSRHGGDLLNAFSRSRDILSRCLSLPISIHLEKETAGLISKTIRGCFACENG